VHIAAKLEDSTRYHLMVQMSTGANVYWYCKQWGSKMSFENEAKS